MAGEGTAAVQCPVCRARFRGARLCSRCGADLGTLMWVAARAWRLRRDARQALLNSDWTAAALLADEARETHATPRGEALSLVARWLASHTE